MDDEPAPMADHYGTDTRERIFRAAREVFRAHGYRSASIRQIVARAGTNLASVNYHFGNKEALYRRVLEAGFVEITEQLSVAYRAALGEDTPEGRIRRFICERIRIGFQLGDFIDGRLIGWEMIAPTMPIGQLFDTQFADINRQSIEILDPLFDAGATFEQRMFAARMFFFLTAPPPELARAFFEMLGPDAGEEEIDRAVDLLADATMAFVKAFAGRAVTAARDG